MAVKAYKLINGEDIIGDIKSDELGFIMIENPAIVTLHNADGKMNVGLSPYAPFAEGAVTVFKNAIAATFEVGSQMVNEYNRIFGSGIIVASANQMPKSIIQ
jgi:hypothetical protein